MASTSLPPADDVVERTIYELNIIAKVGRGQKLSAADSACINIVEPSIASGFYRWRNGDSRDQLMPIIEGRITIATFLANTLLESRHLMIYDNVEEVPSDSDVRMYETRMVQIHRLLETLSNVPAGLANLVETYAEDKYLVYKLNYLAQQIAKNISPPIAMTIKSMRERKMIHKIRQQESAQRRQSSSLPDHSRLNTHLPVKASTPVTIPRSRPETPPPQVKKEEGYAVDPDENGEPQEEDASY